MAQYHFEKIFRLVIAGLKPQLLGGHIGICSHQSEGARGSIPAVTSLNVLLGFIKQIDWPGFNGKNIIVAIADINTRNFTNNVILELFIAK